MSRTITEHELTFALNCLGVDNAMNAPDHTLAASLFEIVDTNRGHHPTLAAGEQSSIGTYAQGNCSADRRDPVDDAIRLAYAAVAAAEAAPKVDAVSSATKGAMTDLALALSTEAQKALTTLVVVKSHQQGA